MAIIRKDGFCFFEDGNRKPSIIMDNRTDDIVDYVNKKSVTSLTIQPMLNDVILDEEMQCHLLKDVDSLDFLARMPHLTELCLKDVNRCNIDGVYALRSLKSLTITKAKNNPSKNIQIDFSRFKDLTELYVGWFDKGFDISGNENLESVCIWKYDPSTSNFKQLPLPPRIRRLELIRSNIKDFEGLCSNTLESLECTYLPKLQSLKGISSAAERLRQIIITSAQKLNDYNEIRKCNVIRDVVFDKCGNIKSIGTIQDLTELEHFVLEKTVVEDGDIRPLLKIKRAAFTNKAHYNCQCVTNKDNNLWHYKIVPKQ